MGAGGTGAEARRDRGPPGRSGRRKGGPKRQRRGRRCHDKPPSQEGARRHGSGWHERWLVSSRPQRRKRTRDEPSGRATLRSRGCHRRWRERQRRGKAATEVGRWVVAPCWCWCRPAAIYSRWCVCFWGAGREDLISRLLMFLSRGFHHEET